MREPGEGVAGQGTLVSQAMGWKWAGARLLFGEFERMENDLTAEGRDVVRATALGRHSRVRAAVTLSNIWRPQFLNQDSDDANKQDEVHQDGGEDGGLQDPPE